MQEGNDVYIADDYQYHGNDGKTYVGSVAYVLNQLDSAQASAEDNFRDLSHDAIFTDDEIKDEVRLYDALSYLIDHPGDLAPYIGPE